MHVTISGDKQFYIVVKALITDSKNRHKGQIGYNVGRRGSLSLTSDHMLMHKNLALHIYYHIMVILWLEEEALEGAKLENLPEVPAERCMDL